MKMKQKKVTLIEADNISRAWKVLHIVAHISAALFGISGGILLSLVHEDENFLCGVPSVYLSPFAVPGTHSVAINDSYIVLDVTTWGVNDDVCDFCRYTLISSFIFATIWMVFFMMCGRGGKSDNGLPQPWRIVLPAMIFSTIFFIIVLAAGAQLTVIINNYCFKFDDELAQIRNYTDTTISKCQNLDLFIKVQHMNSIRIQALMELTEAMAWLCVCSWGCSAALCVLRILYGVDFRLVLPSSNEVDAPVREGEGYKPLQGTSLSSVSPSSSKTRSLDQRETIGRNGEDDRDRKEACVQTNSRRVEATRRTAVPQLVMMSEAEIHAPPTIN